MTNKERKRKEKKEVAFERQGKIKNEDVEKLVENMAEVKASPVWVIKTIYKKIY